MATFKTRSAFAATIAIAGIALSACSSSTAAEQKPTTPAAPTVYSIAGDDKGSKFEGIGVDTAAKTFYVSEASGGEIWRGTVDKDKLEKWKDAGADGRGTARGITVDSEGRVYIAGGPNGNEDKSKPDLWVYSKDGKLEASLRVPTEKAFLNDVWIGPDGAAYFTNSNEPQIFRVAKEGNDWNVTVWADGTGVIKQEKGFNLGGITLSSDKSAFVVAQGNVGKLWRFDIASKKVSAVTGGEGLKDADGLVLDKDNKLTVVRNFVKKISTMTLSADGSAVTDVKESDSAKDRVLTTAKELDGRILYVDSHFDDKPNGIPPYEIITDPTK